MAGDLSAEEESRIDSVLGGARNPNNWLVRAVWLYKSAQVLLEAKEATDERLWSSSLFHMSWLRRPTDEQIREHSLTFEESMGFGMTSVLLRGLAIENLLKGILVQRDADRWVPRPAAANRPLYHWTHDLETLARDADFQLDQEDVRVCRQLTLYVEWGGRYPTAMAPKKHGPEGATWKGDDDKRVDMLFTSLREQLQNAIGIKDL
jgi:hypothetical protein